jgi:hypothetical protein
MFIVPVRPLSELAKEDKPSPVGYIKGMTDAFLQARDQADIGITEEESSMNTFAPGKMIPHDQIPEGLKSAFPENNPVNENVINMVADQKASEDQRQQSIDNSPNNVLSGVGNFVARVLGDVSTPAGALTTIAAPELTLEKLALPAAKNIILRTAQKAGLGAIEGGIANTGAGVANYIHQDQLGENPNFGVIQHAIVDGALSGAALRGVSSTVGEIYSHYKASRVETFRAAQKQTAADKQVDTSLMSKDQYYKQAQSAKERGMKSDDLRNHNSVMEETIADIKKQQDEIFKGSDKEDISSLKKESGFDIMKDTQPGVLSKLVEIGRKEGPERTTKEHNFLVDMQDLDHFKQSFDSQATPLTERSKGQQEILDNVSGINDKKEVLNQISKLKDDIKSKTNEFAGSSISRALDIAEEVKKSKVKLDAYQKRIENINKLSELLKNKKELTTGLVEKSNEFHRLGRKMDDLQNLIDHNDATINLLDNAEPTTQADMQDMSKKMNSPESNRFRDEQDLKEYDNQLQDAKEIDDTSHEDLAREAAEQGRIPKTDIEQIDSEHSAHIEQLKSMPERIASIIKCIRGE